MVGYSGAGKSTLVRTINLLQKPTNGSVRVNGQDMLDLSASELRAARKKIGMIFQHFNLMNARTVAGNILYALRSSDLSREEKQTKVTDLLELVDLADKHDSYPSQLSGGQKQRVGIARALANDPEVLLCDEATSALDPKTTTDILKLLKQLNQELGLTIVLITHEMDAIKEICNKVAVMGDGEVVERGDIVKIFTEPENPLTQEFINTALGIDQALEKLSRQSTVMNLTNKDQIAQLTFKQGSAGQPFTKEVYERYGISTNIIYGNVEILNGDYIGNLIVIFTGDDESLQESYRYLEENHVTVGLLEHVKDGEEYKLIPRSDIGSEEGDTEWPYLQFLILLSSFCPTQVKYQNVLSKPRSRPCTWPWWPLWLRGPWGLF